MTSTIYQSKPRDTQCMAPGCERDTHGDELLCSRHLGACRRRIAKQAIKPVQVQSAQSAPTKAATP